jgi:hypothetical protein
MSSQINASTKAQRPGRYANCFQIGHNAFEFLLDFGQVSSEGGHPSFHTRIIIAPASAKILHELLDQSIQQHAVTFGGSGEPPSPKPN